MSERNYQELFFSQAQQYVEEINNALVRLEKNPNDSGLLNLVFRLVHNIKGMSATMGYKDLTDLSHYLEDIFDCFRLGLTKLSAESFDIIFDAIDAMAKLIEDLKYQRHISDISIYLAKLDEFIPLEEKIKRKNIFREESLKLDRDFLNNFKRQNKNVFHIAIDLREGGQKKGESAILVLAHIRNLGDILKVVPSQMDLKEEKFDLGFELILATTKSAEEIKNEILKIADIEKFRISDFYEKFTNGIEEREIILEAPAKTIKSIRISSERFDKIINLVGELTIAKNRLSELVFSKDVNSLKEVASLIDKLVTTLQEESLKTRLLPISYIFDNLPRAVRDLSRKANKEVNLQITGTDIELDRVILEEIGQPLIHIIRNAIDHGIESSSERIQLGKQKIGTISINVFRQRGHIVIEVSDDGRGIDFEKILNKALEEKLIAKEDISQFDEHKILDILMLPGFSTKEEVGDISGRGFGLDIVRNKINSLGGKVDIETKKGIGTKFILTLPLTLAIIKSMLIRTKDQIFAIPFLNIKETVKISSEDIKLIKNKEAFSLRNNTVPILRLDNALGLGFSKQNSNEIFLVIVEARDRELALAVDQILGVQDIVVKPLSFLVKKVKGITGATILSDGKVALILDVFNLL